MPGPFVPSPTPFQPGSSPSSLSSAVGPAVHATFTPYPVTQVKGSDFSAPLVATPSEDAAFSPAAYNPLTGLVPADPSLLDRRPLVIKISNYPRAIRPQYGLNEADIVFEYYI